MTVSSRSSAATQRSIPDTVAQLRATFRSGRTKPVEWRLGQLEAIVLGRAAMGETMRAGSLRDRLRIWRGGRLIYADALALDADIERLMARAAIGGGASAMAVLVHAAADASTLIGPVRAALEGAKGRAAASTWNGLLAVRLLSPDGETLRHDMTAVLSVLRGGAPLPRVWRC